MFALKRARVVPLSARLVHFMSRVPPLADGFMAKEVSKNRQTIYSIPYMSGAARPSLHGMISPIRTHRPRCLPTSSAGLVVSVGLSVTAATFCENFGVTQKLSQTWACFTRCLGKSGKAAKANSCAGDTRHALLYAPRHACVRTYRANWMCQLGT